MPGERVVGVPPVERDRGGFILPAVGTPTGKTSVWPTAPRHHELPYPSSMRKSFMDRRKPVWRSPRFTLLAISGVVEEWLPAGLLDPAGLAGPRNKC